MRCTLDRLQINSSKNKSTKINRREFDFPNYIDILFLILISFHFFGMLILWLELKCLKQWFCDELAINEQEKIVDKTTNAF